MVRASVDAQRSTRGPAASHKINTGDKAETMRSDRVGFPALAFILQKSTHSKNSALGGPSTLHPAWENTGYPHRLLAPPFLFAETCVLGNSPAPAVGTPARDGGQESLGACTAQQLHL